MQRFHVTTTYSCMCIMHVNYKNYCNDKDSFIYSYDVKGATKLYIMHYSRVVIILFCMGLYKSAFLPISVKLGFRLSELWIFMFVFWFLVFITSVLCLQFNVISKDLTFFNFILTLVQ